MRFCRGSNRKRQYQEELMTGPPRSRTFPDLLWEMAERQPTHDLVTSGGWRMSYREFALTAQRMAGGLRRLGVRPGSKVALMMGNRVEWLLSFAAISMAGAVMVGFNTWWRRREMQYALQLADVEVLILADRFLNNDYLAELAGIDLARDAPLLRTVVQLSGDPSPATTPFTSLLAGGADEAVRQGPPAGFGPESLACLLFTSGSTGRSKAAGLNQAGLIENCFQIGERMHFTAADRLLLCTPLFYSFGCVNGVFAALTHGASIALLPKYDVGELMRVVEEERCTAVYAPADAALSISAHPDFGARDLSSWRTGICPNNVVPVYHGLGVPEMITAYGLTECYGNSSNADCKWPLEKRISGMGTPLPGLEIDIVDPETRLPLPLGEQGEIRIRGYKAPGYYKNPEENARVFDEEGWFYTGDFGAYDPTGVLQFRGRLGEVIKTKGMNVSPIEVEEALLEHDAVQIAVVSGISHPRDGEIVGAMVVTHAGHDISADQLAAHCRGLIASFKVPRFIATVDLNDLPLTDTGKVSRRAARQWLEAQYHSNANALSQ
jgi:fatty-acyl-CoA synthase